MFASEGWVETRGRRSNVGAGWWDADEGQEGILWDVGSVGRWRDGMVRDLWMRLGASSYDSLGGVCTF